MLIGKDKNEPTTNIRLYSLPLRAFKTE